MLNELDLYGKMTDFVEVEIHDVLYFSKAFGILSHYVVKSAAEMQSR